MSPEIYPAIWTLPVLTAITLHELAHGWAAHLLGDDTAARAGRLTLNPLRHLHPIGSLVVPGILLLAGAGAVFGWARPVPYDSSRLAGRFPAALVIAAGPAANGSMALAWAALARAAEPFPGLAGVGAMAAAGVAVNVWLLLLNLLPVPPFDGGRLVQLALPARAARWYGAGAVLVVLAGLLAAGPMLAAAGRAAADLVAGGLLP